MNRKPNWVSGESSNKKNTNETLSIYSCSFCPKSFPTCRAFAGHHNAHRIRFRLLRSTEEENNANNSALAELNHYKRSLSSEPISSRGPNEDEVNSRPFNTLKPYNRIPEDPSPALARTSRSESELELDLLGLASGSSTGGNSSYGENPKKRKSTDLSKLKTVSDDKSWLKL